MIGRNRCARGLDVVCILTSSNFLICPKLTEVRDRVLIRGGVDGVRKLPVGKYTGLQMQIWK